MNEVFDRPTITPTVTTQKPDVQPPPTYKIIALGGGPDLCFGKMLMVLIKVFEKNPTQAHRIVRRLESRGRTGIVRGMSREIAEMMALKAQQVLSKEVDGCVCATDKSVKFSAEKDE